LDRLVTFAYKTLTDSHWNCHNEGIIASLSKGEHIQVGNPNWLFVIENVLQVADKLFRFQSRRVTVTEERMCGRCLKRIGNSVFAMYPNGIVVHVFCLS
jgi:hypothetical protein